MYRAILLLLLLVTSGYCLSGTFDFWYGSSGNTGKVIYDLCQKYNRKFANPKVKCTNLGSYEATLQKTVASYRAGKQPAVVQLFDVAMLDMLMSGTTIPIENISKLKQDIDRRDYFPSVANFYANTNGDLESFPFNVSTIVLYGNRNKLQSAGIQDLPTTWEEFGHALEKLHAAGETCPWIFQLHPWFLLEQFSAVHGIAIASEKNGYSGLNTEYLIANKLNLQMMSDVKRWFDLKLAVLDSNLPLGNPIRAFGTNECALLIESTAAFGAISKLAKGRFEIEIGLLPRYENFPRRNTYVGGASLWVMKGFDNDVYESVYSFLTFLHLPENQLYLANETGCLPLTKSAWSRINVAGAAKPPIYNLVKTGLESISFSSEKGYHGLRLGFYLQFRQLWIKEMQKAFNNSLSIEQALQNTRKSGNLLLRRFQRVYENGASEQ